MKKKAEAAETKCKACGMAIRVAPGETREYCSAACATAARGGGAALKMVPNPKAAKAKEPHVEKFRDQRSLKCILTEPELLAAGRTMADAQSALVSLESEAEEWKTQWKSRVAQCEGVVSGKASVIRSGYEYRTVECETCKDYYTGTVTCFRLDTQAVETSRPMTEDEKQMALRIED